MSSANDMAQGGRAAAIAHRKALSVGKAALPPAQERTRVGKHAAARPAPEAPEAVQVTVARPAPAAAPRPVQESMPPTPVVSAPPSPGTGATGGRHASMQRRRQLSAGKAALMTSTAAPPSVMSSGDSAGAGRTAPDASSLTNGRAASIARRRQLSAGKSALGITQAASPSASVSEAAKALLPVPQQGCAAPTCRDVARARRAAIAAGGRAGVLAPQAFAAQQAGDAQQSNTPAGLTRLGKIAAVPKVTESGTQGGQRVTGIRIGEGRQVTGDERGTTMPVSGSQYIDADSGAGFRAAAPKVGLMRTGAGQTVSGTLVRSQVRITGDEAGASVTITGKVDPRVEDDLTTRASPTGLGSAQFQRQASPHGPSLLGANLGRSVRSAGSRDRSRSLAMEVTEQGQTVTGSALGRSSRMTGDETGACRSITGNQYLTPARAQAACGGAARMGADQQGEARIGKVSVAETHAGKQITGLDVEHNPRVTGDEPGSCASLTGSQYQGRTTSVGWCDTAMARPPRPASHVTGNTPLHASSVTGTARGAGRDITGTSYSNASAPAVTAPADPVAELDTRFSVRSPQRAAHLQNAQLQSQRADEAGKPGRITGSFAVGENKVTGNVEFQPRSRIAAAGGEAPAHGKVSGEGMHVGRITGDAWGAHGTVTGTEGAFAADRNPTQRGPKAKAMAGSTVFKSQAVYEEPKQLVTGMFYFAKTGARVTLSGGAQG